ncbi:MAG: trigger factor, partial [Chthoniobacteraceae bacterium]|nr:trigger factor [Chthoniobacteraceae bacterium]
MNVQLENLPNCLTTLRIEVPSDKVTQAREAIVREYAQYAKLPGFRPGKAPRALVEAKFKSDIQEELQKRLLSDSVREAVLEQKLRVLTVSNVEDLEFAADQSLSFTATVITAPAFELPEYKGLKVEIAAEEVTDKDVDEGIDRLRDQAADFKDVTDRALAMDDFAVITYNGTIDGKPADEVAPSAKILAHNTDFWLKLTTETFLPGFSEKIIGAAIGETREFDLAIPADFAVKDLASKTLHYTVTLGSIKTKVLPEADDAFAATVAPGKTLAEVRDLLRGELTRQKKAEQENAKRAEIMKQLLAKVECELPEGMLQNETQRLLEEVIRENQNRGVPEEVIQESRSQLTASAGENARDRLKGSFILLRIAEAEKIAVTREEMGRHIAVMAMRYQMPVEKLRKELEKRQALDSVNEEILTGKVLDFLVT